MKFEVGEEQMYYIEEARASVFSLYSLAKTPRARWVGDMLYEYMGTIVERAIEAYKSIPDNKYNIWEDVWIECDERDLAVMPQIVCFLKMKPFKQMSSIPEAEKFFEDAIMQLSSLYYEDIEIDKK